MRIQAENEMKIIQKQLKGPQNMFKKYMMSYLCLDFGMKYDLDMFHEIYSYSY